VVTTVLAWLAELAAIPEMRDQIEPLRSGFRELHRKGDDCPDHAELFEGLAWIAGRQDKTPIERYEQMVKLRNLTGKVIIDMKSFTGW
jgi:hypothetical protein